MNIKVKQRKTIACAAIGLIAAGYSLYHKEDSELERLSEKIRDLFSSQELLEYFAGAKTDQSSINPYWPRGSALVIASWFMDDVSFDFDEIAYLTSQKRTSSLSETELNSMMGWIKRAPYYFKEIAGLAKEKGLFEELDQLFVKKKPYFTKEIDEFRKLIETSRVEGKIENIIFSPNLFQADELTDLVYDGDDLIIISTAPRVEDLLHEFLHDIIHNTLITRSHSDVMNCFNKSDRAQMKAYGYAWDDSFASALRVVEESYVRLLTYLLTETSGESLARSIHWLNEEGFFVPEGLSRESLHPIKSISEGLKHLSLD